MAASAARLARLRFAEAGEFVVGRLERDAELGRSRPLVAGMAFHRRPHGELLELTEIHRRQRAANYERTRSDQDVALSWQALADQGNLSSTSVLMVLRETLDDGGRQRGDLGLLLAMGPAFCSELVLVEA